MVGGCLKRDAKENVWGLTGMEGEEKDGSLCIFLPQSEKPMVGLDVSS